MRRETRVRRRLRVFSRALSSDPIEIVGAPLRHLHVLRLRPGDRLYLFDGRGREFESELLHVGRDRAEARPIVKADNAVESPLKCCLVQAVPVRISRMDLIVRQATELGAASILPVLAERSQKACSDDALSRRVARWRRLAVAISEQLSSAPSSTHRRRAAAGRVAMAPAAVADLASRFGTRSR